MTLEPSNTAFDPSESVDTSLSTLAPSLQLLTEYRLVQSVQIAVPTLLCESLHYYCIACARLPNTADSDSTRARMRPR